MARRVEVNVGGVRQVLKSKGARDLLAREASGAAARCNAAYSLKTRPDVEPYGHSVEEHRVVAVGRVFTKTKLGRIDNARSNTLKKGTGW